MQRVRALLGSSAARDSSVSLFSPGGGKTPIASLVASRPPPKPPDELAPFLPPPDPLPLNDPLSCHQSVNRYSFLAIPANKRLAARPPPEPPPGLQLHFPPSIDHQNCVSKSTTTTHTFVCGHSRSTGLGLCQGGLTSLLRGDFPCQSLVIRREKLRKSLAEEVIVIRTRLRGRILRNLNPHHDSHLLTSHTPHTNCVRTILPSAVEESAKSKKDQVLVSAHQMLEKLPHKSFDEYDNPCAGISKFAFVFLVLDGLSCREGVLRGLEWKYGLAVNDPLIHSRHMGHFVKSRNYHKNVCVMINTKIWLSLTFRNARLVALACTGLVKDSKKYRHFSMSQAKTEKCNNKRFLESPLPFALSLLDTQLCTTVITCIWSILSKVARSGKIDKEGKGEALNGGSKQMIAITNDEFQSGVPCMRAHVEWHKFSCPGLTLRPPAKPLDRGFFVLLLLCGAMSMDWNLSLTGSVHWPSFPQEASNLQSLPSSLWFTRFWRPTIRFGSAARRFVVQEPSWGEMRCREKKQVGARGPP